ncbi:MAG TPA: isochorismatase family protein [Solirubrobacteraceae bacterium]|jgi:maleamate amidohydrolase|nr:isochorismatase family protein [Solirubrobacteraceae bacterium]
MSDAGDVYGERGFGGRQGAGRNPALVVIDLNYGFTDPSSPLHCDTDAAVQATARLLEAAREGERAVAFTTIEYDEGAKRVARAFIAKAPALTMLTPGSRWARIDERIAPREDEPVLVKLFASAFFGTALQPMLTAGGCDTLVVAGASTSGCVRATVVDGLQHGLSVLVPREAVADRAQSAHDASLLDIDAKYGDVVSLDEAIAVLRGA